MLLTIEITEDEAKQLEEWRALLEEERYAGIAEPPEITLAGTRVLDKILAELARR